MRLEGGKPGSRTEPFPPFPLALPRHGGAPSLPGPLQRRWCRAGFPAGSTPPRDRPAWSRSAVERSGSLPLDRAQLRLPERQLPGRRRDVEVPRAGPGGWTRCRAQLAQAVFGKSRMLARRWGSGARAVRARQP